MSPSCSNNLQIIHEVCSHLGISLALKKVEGSSEILTFLGITLDTHRLEAQLPPSKLQRIRNEVKVWLKKENATKKSILSLDGLLKHATKVVKPSRTFISRMPQNEKAVSPDQTYHGVQIRLALVGPVHYILEWNQFSVPFSRNFI